MAARLRMSYVLLLAVVISGCGPTDSSLKENPFGIGGASPKGGATPRETYNLSLRYSREGNVDALYDLYDSEAHRAYDMLAERNGMNDGRAFFRRQMLPMLKKIQGAQGMAPNASANVREEINGEHAVIRTGIQSQFGSFNADVELTRENGVWKLRMPKMYRDSMANIAAMRKRVERTVPGIAPDRKIGRRRGAAAARNPRAPAFPAGDVVFLDDLKPSRTRLAPFHRTIGKHGATGFASGKTQKCRVNGVEQAHALVLNGWSSRTVSVEYQIDGRFRKFTAIFGLVKPAAGDGLDRAIKYRWKGKAGSPITFRVVGDDKVLWESQPVQNSDDWRNCEVNIEGVKSLRLSFKCKKSNAFAWGAWVQPQISDRVAE